MNSKKFKFKHSIRAWVSKPTRPNQQLGLSCLSVSSPCLAFMSRKSKTSLLKGRVGVGGGDGPPRNDGQAQHHTKEAQTLLRGLQTCLQWGHGLGFPLELWTYMTRKKNENMQKTAIQEDRNANKQVRSQHWTYARNKSKSCFAIFPGGGAKMDPSCGATCREVCFCSGSHMERRRDFKMSMTDSSATIWRWMKRQAMT